MRDPAGAAPQICLLGEGWPPDRPGGLNRYFADLIDALRAAGAEPRAVTVGPAASVPPGVVVVSAADEPVLRRLRRFAIAATAASRGADVLDTHFALYSFLPSVVGPGRRQHHVVHFHGPWASEGQAAGHDRGAATRAKRWIERRVYLRAEAVVTLSSAFRQLLVESYGVSPWRVTVIAPAVDLIRFSRGDERAARERFSIDPDVMVVGCVRRLTPRMGIDDLLGAWAALPPDAGTGRVLLIAGEGALHADLVALAAELGVTDSVRFLGWLSEADLVEFYRAADVCVVPTVALEGFGLVVLEALACGTPVIATDAGGLPEALAGIATDAIVPAGDAAALSARLDGALTGRHPLPPAVACRRHAETFSGPALAEAHLALYDRVVSGGDDPRIRVVYLDHCAQLSGAEIAMLRLLEALPGVLPHVILAEDGPLLGRLRQAGISAEVLPLDPAAGKLGRDKVRPGALPITGATHTARYVARLTRRLHNLRPALVHCNSLKACVYGSVAARAAGVPVVWHARDRMASDYLPAAAAGLVRTLYRTLPAAAIANSDATLATFGAVRGHEVIVVPDPYRRTRALMPVPTGPLRVGIVGRLAPWKGQHILLDAFARAFPTGRQRCTLIGSAMFGEDDYAADLSRQVERLGIADRVEFRGFRDDIEAEIDALHVLVHASVVPEPFGQVVVEGMAAGRAVVAAAAGGPAEIITAGVDGLLCPPGDVDALAASLRRLDADPSLRERLASAAIYRAADFDPARLGGTVEGLYRRVLDAG